MFWGGIPITMGPMASRLSKPLQRLRRKLTFAVWAGRAGRQGALVLVLAGAAALLGRVAFELEMQTCLWFLAPLALVPFSAWRGVPQRIPSEAGAAAWLDLRSGAKGYLLTDFEKGDERWSTTTREQLDRLPELPSINLASLTRLLLPAMAFAALALFVPITKAEEGPSTSYYDRAIEGIADQLKVLEEVADLDEDVAAELQRRVAQLQENVDPEQPEAMLEAIDSLRKELGLEGQQAAEMAQELMERFGALGEGALGSSEFGQELMAGQLNELMQSGLMTEALSKLGENAPELSGLARNLTGNELNLPEGFKLTPEQMKMLSRLMQSKLRENLGELELAGLANLDALKFIDSAAALAKLVESFHKHDEDCKKPGGT